MLFAVVRVCFPLPDFLAVQRIGAPCQVANELKPEPDEPLALAKRLASIVIVSATQKAWHRPTIRASRDILAMVCRTTKLHKFNADFGKRCDNFASRAKGPTECQRQVLATSTPGRGQRRDATQRHFGLAHGTQSARGGLNVDIPQGLLHGILCISVLAFVAASL